MFQKSLLDLRAFRLATVSSGRAIWNPTSEVYIKRILIVLFVWFVSAIVWLFAVEMPWQWEARRERQQTHQRLKLESEQRARELFKPHGGFPRSSNSRSDAFPIAVSSGLDGTMPTPEESQVEQWQLHVPNWLKALTCVLFIFGLYWPISTSWNRVVLWRDEAGIIWMRFWFLWPRKRSVGQASSTRLIPRVMQEHLFVKRRHIGTRWNWILQLNSDLVARLPNSRGTLAINSRPVVPDILVAEQTHDPAPGDKPPQIVQHWIGQVSQALGISAEQQRMTHQEVEKSWDGRPIRISRETTNIQAPISRTEHSVSLDAMGTKELQTLMNAMAQLGQVRNTEDGQIEITIEKTNNYEDLSSDEMKSILTALPPELRKQVEWLKRKQK